MTLVELLHKPLYVSNADFDRRWRELAATLPRHVGTLEHAEAPIVRVDRYSTGVRGVLLAEATALRVRLDDGTLVDVSAGAEASPRADLEVGARVELLGELGPRAGTGYRELQRIIVGPAAIRRR